MRHLPSIPTGTPCVVAEVGLERDVVAWLAAVGIGVGDEIVILRRGSFGGPLHVRTHTGAEFALALELARDIAVSTREEREERA